MVHGLVSEGNDVKLEGCKNQNRFLSLLNPLEDPLWQLETPYRALDAVRNPVRGP